MVSQRDLTQYKLGWRPRPADPREWLYRKLVSLTVDYKLARSLAKYFPAIVDQGAEGSCTANSSCTAQEAAAAIAAIVGWLILSRMDLYYDERIDEQTFPQDAGAYTADSLDSVLKRSGLVAESVWPYDAQPAETPPAAVAGAARHLYFKAHHPVAAGQLGDGVIAGMDTFEPSVVGFNFYQEFYAQYQQTGIISATPAGQPIGGHQVAAGKYWIPPCTILPNGGHGCPNSWGPTSPARTDLHPDAVEGDIIIPFEAFGNGIVSEVRTVEPLSLPSPTPQPQPTPQKLAVTVKQTLAAIAGQPAGFHCDSNGGAGTVYAIIPAPGQPATAWQQSGDFAITYAQPGTYTLWAFANNPTGQAAVPLAVSVAAPSPGPSPQPRPLPADLRAALDLIVAEWPGLRLHI